LTKSIATKNVKEQYKIKPKKFIRGSYMSRLFQTPGIANAFNDVFPVPIKATRAPTSADIKFSLGQVWVRTDTAQVYILAQLASGVASWTLASPGASDVDTLTGDGGGAISPAAGNITLAGGTNITSAGAGSTITFNLDAAITLATSVTSPIYTVAAATDLAINAVSGQDVIIKMGDAAAANKVSFVDSGSVEVASIDSDGAFTTTGLTFTGLLTANASATILTAGTALNLGSDNSGDAVNLGVGTVARAIGIGDSAAAHTITIGSVTGAASLDLLAGTGNFSLEGNVATTYKISSTGANTGQIDIGTGTGAQTTNIATGGTGVKTVNIATGAIGNVVTIGTVTGAASLDLKAGTGNFTLEGDVATTYAISNTGVNTGQVDIAGGTGARTINIGGGGTGAKTINIGAAASADLITIGDATGAGSLDLVCGTGNFTLEGNVATTYAISATGANTGTITISGGTGAQTTNIATGGTGIKTVNIGTGAIDNVVTIGTVTGAASLDLKVGTGNFTLEGDVASTYEISSTGANTGTCKFASGTGARTVEIAGGGTGIKTINIGAAATADVITIGTTTGAGSLTLAAGTGDITVSGTVKEIDAEFLFSSGTDLTVTQSPILQSNANTGAAPTGATGDVNLMYMQDGCLMEQFILGAGQTIIAPRMTANGLDLSLDQTVSEGAEYNFGARANAKHAYTIGTSAAFFIEATFYVTDYSGCAPLMMGFRKVEANNATLANYTDYAAIGINQATSALNATILSELNAGGQTATDTTDALAAEPNSFTVKVLVSAAGVTTFEVNGSAASAAPAFTFDNADVVMPFIHFLQGADLAGEVGLNTLKIGFQA
jgi:hypothetical protein